LKNLGDIAQQLNADPPIRRRFMLDQGVDQNLSAVSGSAAVKTIGAIFDQFLGNERPRHQFRRIVGQTCRHVGRQSLPQQGARRARLVEQPLEELIVAMNELLGHADGLIAIEADGAGALPWRGKAEVLAQDAPQPAK
jgi:hypothetical protein